VPYAVHDTVGIGEQGAEGFVEGLQNIAEAVKFRLELAASAVRRGRLNLGILSASAILNTAFFSTR
jgi:hypothetical protein